MSRTQKKRKHSALDSEGEDLESINNQLQAEIDPIENVITSSSEKIKFEGLADPFEQHEGNTVDSHTMDNQSNNGIGHLDEIMNDDQIDISMQTQKKRKYSALNSEGEDLESINNQLQAELDPIENIITSSSEKIKFEGLADPFEQHEGNTVDSHTMDNPSNNGIGHLNEIMNDDQIDISMQVNRTRILLPDSVFDSFNELLPPSCDITPDILTVQSPTSSTSTENHLPSSLGSSNSLNSDRDLPDSDYGFELNFLSGEGSSTTEVHEVIDLSSPVLPRGSSDVVDLTLEPNSPTRNNFVDLTRETVDQHDSSPIIVSVNKIYQRQSVIQSRPSCRFEVMPSCSSSQNNYVTDVSDENCTVDDNDLSIENVTRESCVNNSIGETSNSGQIKKSEEKEQFHKSIICPICLDDADLIKRKRQLSSTTCGHVFCDKCIKNAIKTQNKCPTCRKKLTLRQIHPLFLL